MTSTRVERVLQLGDPEHAGDHEIRTAEGPQQVPSGPGRYLDDIQPTDELTHAAIPHLVRVPPGLNAYVNLGCRCPACRSASAEYKRQLRATHREQLRRLLAEATEKNPKKEN